MHDRIVNTRSHCPGTDSAGRSGHHRVGRWPRDDGFGGHADGERFARRSVSSRETCPVQFQADCSRIGARSRRYQSKMAPLGVPLLAGSAGGDGSGGGTARGEIAAAAAAAGVSRPASPGPLADEAQPEPRLQEPAPEAEKPEAAAPMSVVLPARQRCQLALALAAALVSPLVLFYGVYFWLDALHYGGEDARQETCPFVPVDTVAQQTIDDLIAMSKQERDSALHCVWDGGGQCSNISRITVLLLLRDVDDGVFSEAWLASAPIVLRNAFLSWLVVKLFFTASDIQDRGCCGLAIGGHGARESVVGQGPASAAGWLAAVGETSMADLYVATKIWGWGLLGALPGAGAGYFLGLGLYSD